VTISFFAHFLFILAAWTLIIKYVFPMSYALVEGVPILTYVYWDFWWVVHIWLGWSLLHWRRYTYAAAVGVSVVEIAIIATKFVSFLSAPQWTIRPWRGSSASACRICSPSCSHSAPGWRGSQA
jgi:hypothetical protein